jgi:hypothetical protein
VTRASETAKTRKHRRLELGLGLEALLPGIAAVEHVRGAYASA